MHQVSLLVDKDNKNTFVRYVRSGSNPKYIAICIRQSITSDLIVVWDMKLDIESSSHEVT